VPVEKLQKLNKEMLEVPENFNRFKRLDRIFNRRKKMFDEGNKADWGAGEALAYATIISDDIPIRLTGQDSERGTFAHRNLVFYYGYQMKLLHLLVHVVSSIFHLFLYHIKLNFYEQMFPALNLDLSDGLECHH